MDGETLFFSPCHAGCKEMDTEMVMKNGRKKIQKIYSDCSCVRDSAAALNMTIAEPWWKESELKSPLVDGTQLAGVPSGAVGGYCPLDRSKQFSTIIGLLTVMSLLGATGRIGNQLVSLRAVDPADKAASIIIMVSALSLFVFLPSPIIFGSIMDNACMIWGQNCGETTNCLLYDTDAMRNTLCYFVAVCILLATFADIGVWWNCKHIEIFDTEEDNTSEDVEMKNSEKEKNLSP